VSTGVLVFSSVVNGERSHRWRVIRWHEHLCHATTADVKQRYDVIGWDPEHFPAIRIQRRDSTRSTAYRYTSACSSVVHTSL